MNKQKNQKDQKDTIDTDEKIEFENEPKLTQITFNNFDGEKIQKHNDYLRISEKEENEENSGSEDNNDQENSQDKTTYLVFEIVSIIDF